MLGRIKYHVMSDEELSIFTDRMEQLLEKRGIQIEHPLMAAELKAAGCIVEGTHIRFPRALIRTAIQNVPKSFSLYGQDETFNLRFPHPEGSFYTRTCTGAPNYLPARGEKHLVTLDDLREWYHLTNTLENISYVALPSACDERIQSSAIDILALEKALMYSKKHIWIQPYDAENTRYLIKMCAAAAGGMDRLREKPIASFISCSVPVLNFKYMDTEIMYECAKAGIPVQPCALPAAGANTPVTAQGTALAACADVLAQIVMLQILCPGLPVIATPLLFSMDMQTSYTLQSNTEITFGRLICMQAFEEGYGIPCHSYGTGTDSLTLDGQNMIERTSLIHMMAMSDASVLGGAGQLETAKTISPLQLIIDNEIFGIAKRLRRGLAVNDAETDFDELLAGDDANGYLQSSHTLAYYSRMHRPQLFFKGHLQGTQDETRTLLDRALETYDRLMSEPKACVLPPERAKLVHQIALQACADLSEDA